MSKVMIADDEIKVCQLIQNLVNWADFDMEVVGVAHNGVEAIELIEQLHPDLVITDIRMPGYDGIEMIRRTKEIDQNIDFIIISGYRHFDYAQSAIRYGVRDYLLKPIKKDEFTATLSKMAQRHKEREGQLSVEEALRHRLKSDVDRLRVSLFNDLLFTAPPTPAPFDMNSVNTVYHYSFSKGYFQVIHIKTDLGYRSNAETVKYLADKTRQLISSILKPLCFDAEVVFHSSDAFCLLNFSEQNKELMRKQYKILLGEMTVQSNLFEQLEITIGIGEAVSTLEQVPVSFAAAAAAVEQRLFAGTGKLIDGVVASDEKASQSLITPEITKRLNTAIEMLDKYSVISIIQDLKAASEAMRPKGAQGLFKNVCDFYRSVLYQLCSTQLPIENESELISEFITNANNCGSLEALFESLSTAVENILSQVITDKMQADTRPIRQAKQYIQQNYMQPLSLEEVSHLIGFNTSYFSTLFKKETNKNFLEYITEVRMEMAKEMLRETRMSIAEVCSAVGYSDLKHFTKRFIKHTGIKPTEYRKIYS